MIKSIRISVASSLLVLSTGSYAIENSLGVKDLPKLTQESQHVASAKRVSSQFLRAHYKQIDLDDELSIKIFDRFIQAENSGAGILGGAGLGLAICKAYTELLGGEIWLNSKEKSGTEFYFTIPLGRAKSQADNRLAENILNTDFTKSTILILSKAKCCPASSILFNIEISLIRSASLVA